MTVVRQKLMQRLAACPLSRPAGEGWGEGGSYPLCRIFANQSHPNFSPSDRGRDKVAVVEKSSKNPVWSFLDDLIVF